MYSPQTLLCYCGPPLLIAVPLLLSYLPLIATILAELRLSYIYFFWSSLSIVFILHLFIPINFRSFSVYHQIIYSFDSLVAVTVFPILSLQKISCKMILSLKIHNILKQLCLKFYSVKLLFLYLVLNVEYQNISLSMILLENS